MTSFRLKNRFDIITCLFRAIGHVKTETRMRRAVRNMADRLQPGGLMILEPWITPANFQKGLIGWDFVDKPNLKIARISISKVRGPISAFEYHYLIGTIGKVEYVVDKVSSGLWTHEEHLEAFRDAALKESFDSEG